MRIAALLLLAPALLFSQEHRSGFRIQKDATTATDLVIPEIPPAWSIAPQPPTFSVASPHARALPSDSISRSHRPLWPFWLAIGAGGSMLFANDHEHGAPASPPMLTPSQPFAPPLDTGSRMTPSPPVTATPEPSTWALLATGLVLVGWCAKRTNRVHLEGS